jgi:DNA mismatch repair protein MSH6
MANLEIIRSDTGSTHGSLLHVLDQCTSNGGKRLLRAWLCRPLFHVPDIRQRQAAVLVLQGDGSLLEQLLAVLRRHPDLSRCVLALPRSHLTS